ncbi:MAG TPA: 5-formyltetrahydrofolate cyclo-ligase [Verrucomicrobiae bacterium]
MVNKLDAEKSALREQIRTRLKTIPAAERAAASAQLRTRLAQEKFFADAKTILFFAPLPGEPDIWPLIPLALGLGKLVALPRFSPKTQAYVACRVLNPQTDIEIGKFGIREPSARCAEVPLNQLDFILVPGVAFDLNGRRLGRGKGFYDRLLAQVRGVTCGVAFEQQIAGEVPAGPHDVGLNCILTPTRWVEPKQRAVL